MSSGGIAFDSLFRHYGTAIDQFAGRPDLLNRSGLDDAIYRSIVMLLSPQHFSIADQSGDDAPLPPDRLDRLCDYILSRLDQPLTRSELEAKAGLSTRALQYAFQRRFQCTPGQWMTEQKLLAVHRALQRGDGSTRISQVAINYFSNLGDFSRLYRSRFGELPSDTLKRARR